MLKFLDHLEEWLIATLMGAATCIIFVAVVHQRGNQPLFQVIEKLEHGRGTWSGAS